MFEVDVKNVMEEEEEGRRRGGEGRGPARVFCSDGVFY